MARSTMPTPPAGHEAIRYFVRTVDDVPVVLIDPHLDVLAASPIVRAIEPDLTEGSNLLRIGVRVADHEPHPNSVALHVDLAVLLRGTMERAFHPEVFTGLVADLLDSSPGFSAAWEASEIRPAHRPVSLTRAKVGPLLLDAVRVPLERAGTALVFVRSADEATRERLKLLIRH